MSRLEQAYNLLDAELKKEITKALIERYEPRKIRRFPMPDYYLGWFPSEPFEDNLLRAEEEDDDAYMVVKGILFNALIEQFGGKI